MLVAPSRVLGGGQYMPQSVKHLKNHYKGFARPQGAQAPHCTTCPNIYKLSDLSVSFTPSKLRVAITVTHGGVSRMVAHCIPKCSVWLYCWLSVPQL